jgi:hypothetical protein
MPAGCTARSAPTTVCRRLHHAFDMVYDPIRARLVAFSGTRTLAWDGHDWRSRATANVAESRFGHRMVWDSVAFSSYVRARVGD